MLSACDDTFYVDKNIFRCDDAPMLPLSKLFDVGGLVRALRESKGIKGEEKIKKHLHTDKDTLSRIERTSRFDTEILERIAKALGTSIAELYAARDAIRLAEASQARAAGAYVCPDPKHEILHRWLDELLARSPAARAGIIANIGLMYAAITRGSTELPEELKDLAAPPIPEPKVRVSGTKK